MAYMKRNVNLLLMLLVIIVLLSIVILTTFYQQNYRNLTKSYEATTQELSMVSENFSSKLNELQTTTKELSIKSTDKDKLDDLYDSLNAERNKLDTELTETKRLLSETIIELQDTSGELSDAKYTIIKQEEEITMLDSAVRVQKSKLDDLRDDNCNLNKQLDPDYDC